MAWCILEPVELAAVVMVEQDSRMAMRATVSGARHPWAILWHGGTGCTGLVDGRSLMGGEQGWRWMFRKRLHCGKELLCVGRGAVGVGTGEPERGSGCRVRVGVVERGGVLERLLRGVPPIGEGKS